MRAVVDSKWRRREKDASVPVSTAILRHRSCVYVRHTEKQNWCFICYGLRDLKSRLSVCVSVCVPECASGWIRERKKEGTERIKYTIWPVRYLLTVAGPLGTAISCSYNSSNQRPEVDWNRRRGETFVLVGRYYNLSTRAESPAGARLAHRQLFDRKQKKKEEKKGVKSLKDWANDSQWLRPLQTFGGISEVDRTRGKK